MWQKTKNRWHTRHTQHTSSEPRFLLNVVAHFFSLNLFHGVTSTPEDTLLSLSTFFTNLRNFWEYWKHSATFSLLQFHLPEWLTSQLLLHPAETFPSHPTLRQTPQLACWTNSTLIGWVSRPLLGSVHWLINSNENERSVNCWLVSLQSEACSAFNSLIGSYWVHPWLEGTYSDIRDTFA